MTFRNEPVSGGEAIVNSFATLFKSSFQSDFGDQLGDVNSDSVNNINFGSIREEKVYSKLKNLKPQFTAGADLIPAFLVKDAASVLYTPLTFLFNLAIHSQTFPECWKTSKIIPLFKKGDKTAVENYRPIAILNNFAKVFEQIIFDIIYYQIKNIIVDNQHGFIQRRSTITNLMTITHYIAVNLDEGFQTDVIYTDFSKAFDSLNHRILLRKLSEFGFSNSVCKFFQNYLARRNYFVENAATDRLTL